MKNPHSRYWRKYSGYRLLALALALFLSAPLFAQEEEGPISSRMSISTVQGDEATVTLKGLARAKIEGRYTGLPGLEVQFMSMADTLEKELGTATTDADGEASLKVPKKELLQDTAGAYTVMAVFAGNEEFGESDDEIAITDAQMNLEPVAEDSSRTINISLESRGEPVAEELIYVFVKSYINPLKVGEATTDEDGMAAVDFPMDLPGGKDGKLHIFARLDGHWEFGTVEAHTVQDWGAPIAAATTEMPRALWSPNPPLWLLLTFIILLAIIWGHYLEVIYRLFKMRKQAPES